MSRNRTKLLTFALSILAATILAAGSHATAQTKFDGKDPFPKKLKKSGSYLQVTNITIPAKDTTSTAVQVTASNVTVDLQGYTISGPGSGTGIGIDASGFSNVIIQNGIITAMGGPAIKLGPNSVVRNVQIIGNGGDGIDCGPSCLVSNSLVSGNSGVGLNFTDASSGYVNNVLSGNSINVTNGTNMGGNVCNSGLCP